MIIKSINLHHFRKFGDKTITFEPDVNVIYGENAVGKTTIIEAVYLFARGKSFRTTVECDLVGSDSADPAWCTILLARDGELRDERKLSVLIAPAAQPGQMPDGISIRKPYVNSGGNDCGESFDKTFGDGGRKSFRVNKTFYIDRDKSPSASAFLGEMRAVLFCPDHLSLIRGASEIRRAFLDQAISQTDKRYVESLSRAVRGVKNRTSLLRSAQDGTISISRLTALIKPWNDICAAEFAFISDTRRRFVEDISADFDRFYREMSALDGTTAERARIKYSSDSDGASYAELYERNLSREAAAGRTLFGTHHDDAAILLESGGETVEAKRFASQGQQRTLAIALKLAEGEYSKRRTGEYPVYLFDDVLSELDGTRRRYVMRGLSGRQVIITTCVPDLTEGFGANLIGIE